jgi:hypothetical protein
MAPLTSYNPDKANEDTTIFVAPDGTEYYRKPPSEDEESSAAQPASTDAANQTQGNGRVMQLLNRLFQKHGGTPVDPQEKEVTELLKLSKEEPHPRKEVPYPEWVGWVVACFAGAFVGYGVGMMSGVLGTALGAARLWYSIVCVLVGIGLVTGLKASVGTIWYTLGRRSARLPEGGPWWTIAVATVLTVTLIAAEVALGAVAFQTYLSRSTFSLPGAAADHAIPAIVLVLIALCVTMPLLILEAFSKYAMGRSSLSLEEETAARKQAEQERKQRLFEERARKAEEERLKQAQEEQRRRDREYQEYLEKHRKAQETWEKDQEKLLKYETLPDYQAFLKYLSEVLILRQRIHELKREITNYRISRGYGRP